MDTGFNVTSGNQTFYLEYARLISLSVILFLIIIATIAGNVLVVTAVVIEHSLRHLTNYFIVSLATADLLIGITVLPFSATYEILGYWAFGPHICVMWCAIDVLCCTASILNLVAISVDRYLAISKPMLYPHLNTPKRVAGTILFVWLLATAISVPPLFGWRNERDDPNQCNLTSGQGYVIYSALGSFYIPLIVMLFVYSQIYRVAVKQSAKIKQGLVLGDFKDTNDSPIVNHANGPRKESGGTTSSTLSSSTGQSQDVSLLARKAQNHVPWSKRLKRFAKEKKAAKTLGIVVGVFALCWMPFFLIYVIRELCTSCTVTEAVFDTFFWLGYCNSFLNPIIYPCLNRDFRKAFIRIFSKLSCRKSVDDFNYTRRRVSTIIQPSKVLRISVNDSGSGSSQSESPRPGLFRRQSAANIQSAVTGSNGCTNYTVKIKEPTKTSILTNKDSELITLVTSGRRTPQRPCTAAILVSRRTASQDSFLNRSSNTKILPRSKSASFGGRPKRSNRSRLSSLEKQESTTSELTKSVPKSPPNERTKLLANVCGETGNNSLPAEALRQGTRRPERKSSENNDINTFPIGNGAKNMNSS